MGVVVGIAIAAIAIFALTHALRHVNYDEVFAIVGQPTRASSRWR